MPLLQCEINSMPDLNSSTPLTQYHHTYPVDHEVKSRMLADLFTALRFEAPTSPPHAVDRKEANGVTGAPSCSSVGATSTAAAASRNIGGFERLI